MTKILIIEDEVSFSEAITFLLKKEGFEVVVANNGQDGLNAFDKQGADLILLDLMLPGVSGTEVCRQIRLKSTVPIIMLTARDTEIDKVVGLELGADDYVTKPFSFEGKLRTSQAENGIDALCRECASDVTKVHLTAQQVKATALPLLEQGHHTADRLIAYLLQSGR